MVRTNTSTPPSAPVDGTSYTPGSSALGGTIVSSGFGTTFLAAGLNPSTQYWFWIYSYNGNVCSGPFYKQASPLSGNAITLSCTGLTGTYTVGPTGTYPSITAALAAAAAGMMGPVIFELQSTYVSSVETFPITISPFACIFPITIRPQTGAVGLSITSANATGTINYNDGDFVTFDGRPGGLGTTSQLTISNTTLTGYAIQFINGATFNGIKYCTVAGVNTGTASGVIVFGTTNQATGNSNNRIDNCDIRDGATTPQILFIVRVLLPVTMHRTIMILFQIAIYMIGLLPHLQL